MEKIGYSVSFRLTFTFCNQIFIIMKTRKILFCLSTFFITVGAWAKPPLDALEPLEPFEECVKKSFIITGSPSSFEEINLTTGDSTQKFKIGGEAGEQSINSIGYSTKHNLIFGLGGEDAGTLKSHLIAIGDNGWKDLGEVTYNGAPLVITPVLGDMDKDGYLWVAQNLPGKQNVYKISCNYGEADFLNATLVGTVTWPGTANLTGDWAFPPVAPGRPDSVLYTAGRDGYIYRLGVPATAGGTFSITKVGSSTVPLIETGDYYGSVFFDTLGLFYAKRNGQGGGSSAIWKITDVHTNDRSAIKLVENTTHTEKSDGARCRYAYREGWSLPVTLRSFSGKLNANCGAELAWVSGVENEFGHYEVQRSPDGIANSFETIGRLSGKGSGSSYDFVDYEPMDVNFYRLRMVDVDGSEGFSRVVRLSSCATKGQDILIAPTVTKSFVKVFGQSANAKISVVNLVGRTLIEIESTSEYEQSLDLSDLPVGMYLVVVKAGEKSETFKVFKTN